MGSGVSRPRSFSVDFRKERVTVDILSPIARSFRVKRQERRSSISTFLKLRRKRFGVFGEVKLVVLREDVLSNLYETCRSKTGDLISLGTGAGGEVVRARHYKSNQIVAMKRIVMEHECNVYLKEIYFLGKLDHPCIVRAYEGFLSMKTNLFDISMELCTGGDLYTYQQGLHRVMEEQTVLFYITQMLGAVRFVHSKGIIHRDIKLENWVFRDAAKTQLVLVDFGLSGLMEGDTELSDRVGTPFYLAPEVIKSRYGPSCDIWSLGVVLFVLLSGKFPFDGEDSETVFQLIQDKEPNFSGRIWDERSQESKQFTASLLDKNEITRPTAQRALQDRWIEQQRDCRLWNEPDRAEVSKIIAELAESMKKFESLSKIRQITLYFVALLLEAEQRVPFVHLFSKLDQRFQGDISLSFLLEFELPFDREEFRKIFSKLDWSMTGQLELTQFIAFNLNENEITREQYLRVFDHIRSVAGGDIISKENFEEILPAPWMENLMGNCRGGQSNLPAISQSPECPRFSLEQYLETVCPK